ncbi:hypothetical protein [Chitinophaga agri]|uniref:Uncharacterized protein n=1 Tax=Chitinophaga agri TaxID=2703787 RepID=A0A6B9ZC83_9BACT|nr:hypothetical protein [Chitinophaga agri]QHS58203.1 hypothetical protein GWR21_00910 [Chitinophaga agri]
MTLTALISYFRKGGSYEEFCLSCELDARSEVIEIYMEQPWEINNDIALFEIEKTEGLAEYTANNKKYSNLFDFYYFLDVVDESKNMTITDGELAERLLSYVRDDA